MKTVLNRCSIVFASLLIAGLAAPGVVQLEVELLSIMPYAKLGSDSGDDDYAISTLGSAEVTVSAEFRDSSTRAL